ncbi:DUF4159 domain-containing protein, partial [Acidobacteria bacterium AH-259-G07]|nr:DUF4159 domain-containing protein [Acidobacteria bacterium AH-259-G07]
MTKTQTGLLTVLVIQFLVVEGGISSPTPSLDAVGQRESTEFTFARVQFNSYGRWGRTPGWAHDYPRAERNFLTILSDVTGIQTSPESYVIVQLDDPEIMKYPILYFSEPGSWNITSEEAEN